jgi:Mn2+/Fe2+ NRAMP family transporter
LNAFIKKLGPGFLFAGAAIGVSHLVQSTRAGAQFGFGLLWALLLINAIKYPFFQFGTRYANATQETLLTGYYKMGKWMLVLYLLITFATMFTIQTAVTIVTAGIASSLFGGSSLVLWTAIILLFCFGLLLLGRFKALDSIMKFIVILLTISTLVAVGIAGAHSPSPGLKQVFPTDTAAIAFLIAFMGWMPAPFDIAVWQSIWTLEKKKINPAITPKQSLLDFNVGYVTTIILGIAFVGLGALVMHPKNMIFSGNGIEFANQLIAMYTTTLGEQTKYIIGIAALTTMISTTLTTLDASPRVVTQSLELIKQKTIKNGYLIWVSILASGTLLIFVFLVAEMKTLVKIATILSFLTAPLYAYFNLRLITSKHTPKDARPSKLLVGYSIVGIILLVAFSIWYLTTLF